MNELPDPYHEASQFEDLSTQGEGFWQSVRRRFRESTVSMIALRFVLFLALVGLLADVIAYDKPLICDRGEGVEFPLLMDYLGDLGLYQRPVHQINEDWRKITYAWAIWPPVRYLPKNIDYDNQRLLSPFSKQKIDDWKLRHFLGTTRDGRDVLSGLIHGTRISLTIGILAVGLASIIGIFLGATAGYYGDRRIKLSTIGIVFGIIGLVLGFFYGFQVRSYALKDALTAGTVSFMSSLMLSFLIMFGVTVLLIVLAKPLERIPLLGKKRYIWIDSAVSRWMEIQSSIPVLLLIITLSTIIEKKSISFVIMMIGLFGWIAVARFMRVEMLRTRSMLYIESARATGMSDWRILFRHAIPNSLTSVFVVMTFGIANAIISEAILSFLGIGVPDEVVTWGGLLNEARNNYSAWWLTVFPGICLFATVTAFNLIGERLRDVLDPRLRHE